MRVRARIAAAAVSLAMLGWTAPTRAGWGPPGVASPPEPAAPTTPPADADAVPALAPASSSAARDLLTAADAALAAGNLGRAQGLLARIMWEHPSSPEASEARRALRIVELRDRGPVGPVAPKPVPPPSVPPPAPEASEDPAPDSAPDPIVLREEPYSTRTSERLRLTTWEKLDFGVTAFLYGMSLGLTFSIGLDHPDSSEVTMPVALGAMAYTLGAVAYLNAANPDRGDLPLILAITSYVPTTTLLLSNVMLDNPSEKKVAFASVGAGLLSIPLAIAITQKTNLDPGDTQLVRDAGFWGLVVFTTGTLGFGSEKYSGGDVTGYATPSARKVSGMGLLGLYGGMGAGLIAARATEVSLERVRVATWGGYGGAILGGMIGGSMSGNDADLGLFKGVTIGALTGLLVTFVATAGLDGIPPADKASSRSSMLPRWTPGLTPLVGANGRQVPGLGIAGVL